MHRSTLHALFAIGILTVLCIPGISRAAITYNVSFNDPGSVYASYYSSLQACTVAAGAESASRLSSAGNVSIEVQISFGSNPTAQGGSFATNPVHTNGPYSVFEWGATSEIRTGVDPNGAALPDVNFIIGTKLSGRRILRKWNADRQFWRDCFDSRADICRS